MKKARKARESSSKRFMNFVGRGEEARGSKGMG